MSDYSILQMLQRRMAAAVAAREPFPRDPAALRQRLDHTRDALRAGQNVVFGEGEDYVLAELRNVEDFGCHDGWHVCAAGWWIDATTVGARVHVAGMDRGVV